MDGLSALVTLPQHPRIGRCPNEFYCELGNEYKPVTVEPGEPFICPSCGKPLVPYVATAPSPRLQRLPFVILGLVAAAGYLTSYVLLHHPAAPPVAIHPVTVADNAVSLETMPARLLVPAAAETAIATVRAPPSAHVAATPPPPAARRPPRPKHPPTPPLEPPRPGSKKFVIMGGMPSFPDVPATAGSAVIHVNCLIGVDSTPSDCRADGEAPFRRAVLSWLASGHVRLAPATNKGAPIAERRSWDITFEQDD